MSVKTLRNFISESLLQEEEYIPDLSYESRVWQTIVADIFKNQRKNLDLISPDEQERYLLLAAAIAVAGNESSFGLGSDSRGVAYTDWVQMPLSYIGTKMGLSKDVPKLNPSVGPTQIKLETISGPEFEKIKQRLGIDSAFSLEDISKAIILTATILKKNYDVAVSLGYSKNDPGVNKNFPNISWKSTGNAALDLALAAYNAGSGKVLKRWCGVPGNTKPCESMPVGTPQYKNYIPRYAPADAPESSSGTLGYIRNVSLRLTPILTDLETYSGILLAQSDAS